MVRPYELFAEVRSRLQTWWFAWRLRLAGARAGARVTVFAARPRWVAGRPVYRRLALRRLASGVVIDVRRGADVAVHLGPRTRVGADASLTLAGGVLYLGDGAEIGDGSAVHVDGALVLGEGSSLGVGGVLRADGGDVELRAGTRLGDGAAALAAEGAPTAGGRGTLVAAGGTLLPGADTAPDTRVDALAAVPAAARRDGSGRRRRRPLVSVVVSTRDRAHLLPRLFHALGRQTLGGDAFEVVVADDGSADGTWAYLEEAAADAPFPLRTIRRDRPGGPGAGRNAGWRAARAEVIAFTDDDCAPAPEWLEAGLEAMRESGAGIVQGRTLPEPREIGSLRGLADSQRIEFESGRYETCNVFYRRELVEAVGGFEEDVSVGEDAELAWLARGRGATTAFARDALVHHAVHPAGLRDYARRFARWAEVHRVVRRTPGVRAGWFLGWFWTRFHAWFLLALAGGLAAVALALGGVRWWWAALALCLPYARFLLIAGRESTPLPVRVARAPVRLAADVVEVATLVRGSVRHRTLLV